MLSYVIPRQGVFLLILICTWTSDLGACRAETDPLTSPSAVELEIGFRPHICQQNGELTQAVMEGAELCKFMALSCNRSSSLICFYPVKTTDSQANVKIHSLLDYTLVPDHLDTFREKCKDIGRSTQLTVIMHVDYENAFHFTYLQAFGLYTALRRFAVEWESFLLVLSDGPQRGYSNKYIPVYELLSGNRVKFLHEMPASFCSLETILGFQQWPNFPMPWQDPVPLEALPALQPKVAGFRNWMLQKHGILEPADEHQWAPRLLIALRSTSRRLVNADAVAEAARARGWHVILDDFSEKTYKEQLHAMSQTSFFMGPHGAAFGLLPFLPRNAVSMELQPYAYG